MKGVRKCFGVRELNADINWGSSIEVSGNANARKKDKNS